MLNYYISYFKNKAHFEFSSFKLLLKEALDRYGYAWFFKENFNFKPRILKKHLLLKHNMRSNYFMLTMAFCLSIIQVWGMDNVASPNSSLSSSATNSSSNSNATLPSSTSILIENRQKGEMITSNYGGLTAWEVKDNNKDSLSYTLTSQKKLLNMNRKKKRILSIDGGGVRGLFTAVELCILEQIINHPKNNISRENFLNNIEKPTTNYLSIRDVFDIFGGTSTGSILAAGLVAKVPNNDSSITTFDLAKIYARYGYKIFNSDGETFRMGAAGYAKYNPQGLKDILESFFKLTLMTETYENKHLYIFASNESRQSLATFCSMIPQEKSDDLGLHRLRMSEAILASTAAPTYLPAQHIPTQLETMLMSDGGSILNNPSTQMLNVESLFPEYIYELYNFGSGNTDAPEPRTADSGILHIGTILGNILTQQEKIILDDCRRYCFMPTYPLVYLARLDPYLESDKIHLDDTSQQYVQYSIQKALELTRGDAFADMISRLGFTMLSPDDMTELHAEFRKNLNSIRSQDYKKLDDYEKEFIVKKILELDLESYVNRTYYDMAQRKAIAINDNQANKFLTQVSEDIEVRLKNSSTLKTIWNGIIGQSKQNLQIVEIIMRSAKFHRITRGKKLRVSRIDCEVFGNDRSLPSSSAGLTTTTTTMTTTTTTTTMAPTTATTPVSAGSLSLAPTPISLNRQVSDNDDDDEWWSIETSINFLCERNETSSICDQLIKNFGTCCEKSEEYVYNSSKSDYILQMAQIYWTDVFIDVRNQLEPKHLKTFQLNINKNIDLFLKERPFSSKMGDYAALGRGLFGVSTINTRIVVLKIALEWYIAKFHKA